MLKPIVDDYTASPSRAAKEPLWVSFHSLTPHFYEGWATFCRYIGVPFDPTNGVLGVHVAHQIFGRMIHLCSTTMRVETEIDCTTELTENELSALFYVTGYIIRSVRQSIKGTDTASKQKHMALDAMCTFMQDDQAEEPLESFVARWTALTNRGGLTIATNTAFELFLVFERKCREHLNVSQVTKSCHQIDVNNIVTTLLGLDEVALLWADMTAEHLGDLDTANKDDDTLSPSDSLLQQRVTKYMSVRMHSFAKTMMEQYKPTTGKSRPRNKSLCDTLKLQQQ